MKAGETSALALSPKGERESKMTIDLSINA